MITMDNLFVSRKLANQLGGRVSSRMYPPMMNINVAIKGQWRRSRFGLLFVCVMPLIQNRQSYSSNLFEFRFGLQIIRLNIRNMLIPQRFQNRPAGCESVCHII